MSERVLNYLLTEAKADTVDGVRETPVNVVTEAKDGITNTVTVTEVKRLIREAIDHFEKEEGGVTEEEMREALADYAKKVGPLPYFEVTKNTKIKDFVFNNDVNNKAVCIKVTDDSTYGDAPFIGVFRYNVGQFLETLFYELEILDNVNEGMIRFADSISGLAQSKTFSQIMKDEYRNDYALAKKVSSIRSYNEGTTLTDSNWRLFKSGDILKVGHMRFVVDVFETTGEGAYKGITGKMISSITNTSISVISIDWRTVGEGYTALTPVTTTFSVGGNE